ncbi:class I ribonucleotide reductase maintenance protein YfaE [Dongshaea marina]|uniref:class I ribonucleotide reductase maintenance protein YfaE n=1 Tax=Dongshaea marina TaxID=2047966 RepID=UPI0018FFF450|nr:class I ribonucleotide reductase maintenance protein YfaE [Dongshaea marina]
MIELQPSDRGCCRPVLERLEAQDIRLPFQCRSGYCGACRVKRVSGEVEYLLEPLAFFREDEILPCCCVAKGKLTLKRWR